VTLLLVAVAGGIGAAARYLVEAAFAARVGDEYPWGTLVVNVTGCFLAGLLSGPVLTTGLVGGYTTFSAYAVQVVRIDGRSRAAAVGYGVGSVLLGVLAAGLGLGLR